MTRCRWNRETKRYEVDGEVCRTDEHGDPTYHCTARTSCAVHIGPDDKTCPRCVGRTRQDIRTIRDWTALTLPQAVSVGVESDAAILAGPAADPSGALEQRIARNRRDDYDYLAGRIDGDAYLERLWLEDADDGEHPTNVLGTWEMMLREDYGQPCGDRITLASAADYLDGTLNRVAQDPEQDFALMAQEIRSCRERLMLALRAHRQSEHGAPCPACIEESEDGKGPKLRREWGHWCTEEDCERLHYLDASGDEWVCPRNPTHRFAESDYRIRVAERYDETRESA